MAVSCLHCFIASFIAGLFFLKKKYFNTAKDYLIQWIVLLIEGRRGSNSYLPSWYLSVKGHINHQPKVIPSSYHLLYFLETETSNLKTGIKTSMSCTFPQAGPVTFWTYKENFAIWLTIPGVSGTPAGVGTVYWPFKTQGVSKVDNK